MNRRRIDPSPVSISVPFPRHKLQKNLRVRTFLEHAFCETPDLRIFRARHYDDAPWWNPDQVRDPEWSLFASGPRHASRVT